MNSQFDGNVAFSGGGFMPSQATQATDFGASPTKSRDTLGCLPLTVKQINEVYQTSDDKSNFVVDGVDVVNVTLLGMIANKSDRSTEVKFILDDGTGRIECMRWMSESIDLKEMEAIQDGMYVRINGTLKGLGKRQLIVYCVRPVTDYNEIAYHFINCIYVHVYNTKLQKGQGSNQTPFQMTNSGMSTPARNGSMGYQAPPNQFAEQNRMSGIQGLDKRIMDYLNQPIHLGRESGIHRNEFVQQLKVPMDRINHSLKSLEEEGQIYSTIDDDHFRSTANG
ncbi:hypothetical protein GIB67_023338 [Kingdonia uniflora]|uniref:Replication protein A 32 kDa subunit n=1 Tax=Kingdonia uniflora TaxID=39325 RepID=A0A7J7LI45_9MAGN|nr:hypothetical protein GIB67_023338 [Kingdonia uniflora]